MDRTTKILLAIIAAGLWANVGVKFINPAYAYASSYCSDATNCLQSINSWMSDLKSGLSSIESAVRYH